ncbi:signal peptidase II [Arsenophonus symbiont of Ornithomya chloropus]|uniref:signal peptidase II n=1 Tax=Arsenophonus symbiont of Ornithomya chloropus TaxID=634121 RepID=UPI0032B18667
MKKKNSSNGLSWLWLSTLIFFVDIFTKKIIVNNFELYSYITLMPYLNITYVRNYGAAFSFLAHEKSWEFWFFVFMGIIICIILIFIMYHQEIHKKISNIAYAIIIGGALGNLCDRFFYGFVIDFIDFHVNNLHWPTFNIADIAICIGAGLIILDHIIHS